MLFIIKCFRVYISILSGKFLKSFFYIPPHLLACKIQYKVSLSYDLASRTMKLVFSLFITAVFAASIEPDYKVARTLETQGEIQSPNYPDNYPNNHDQV